jgi:hypothetical protein
MPRHSLEAGTDLNASGSLIRIMLRLACLLFIGFLKNHCRVSPTAVAENQHRLARLLTTMSVDWSLYMDLRLWVLTISALATEGSRKFYVSEIASTMDLLGMTVWKDAHNALKELIWIGVLLDQPVESLGIEVEAFRATSVP